MLIEAKEKIKRKIDKGEIRITEKQEEVLMFLCGGVDLSSGSFMYQSFYSIQDIVRNFEPNLKKYEQVSSDKYREMSEALKNLKKKGLVQKFYVRKYKLNWIISEDGVAFMQLNHSKAIKE